MNIDDLIKNIEKFMIKNNKQFFGYAWRENINEMLKKESKYEKLISWINDRIEFERNNINVFNPADKNKNYINEYFKNYKDSLSNISFLLNIKYTILDNKCTNEMRENCLYAICKNFNINIKDFV